jgi:hypothetical protein
MFIPTNIILTLTTALYCSVVIAEASSSSSSSNDDIHLVMYETELDDLSIANVLVEQASQIPGLTATIVGQGTTFEGFGSKYEAVIPFLRTLEPDALVVLSDGRDVLMNHPALANSFMSQQAVRDFRNGFELITKQFPGAIVISAEAQCCVGALTYAKPGDYFDFIGDTRKERACYSGHAPCLWNGDDKAEPWMDFMKELAMDHMAFGDDIYLNAGLMTGTARDMLRVFDIANFQLTEDDQAVLTDYMYHHPTQIILDYHQLIFGNNRHSNNGCTGMFETKVKGERLSHIETGSTPLFIHSPGGFVSCHESLANQLGVNTIGAESRRKLQEWKQDAMKGKSNYGKPKKPKKPKCKWWRRILFICRK